MEITTHTPGSFCTAVLRTRDIERAAAFYGTLIGWTTKEVSLSPRHSLLQFGGKTVAGLHQIDDGNDLWVPHVSVENFYERLFGWSSKDTSFQPFESYTVFKRGDVQEGGLLPIGKDWEVSPRWNSIFNVGNCDATLEQAQTLGGCPVFVHTVPNAGRIGSLSDPEGAAFVIRGPVS